MVFSSLIFIYAFFSANLLCCTLANNIRVQNTVLLVFSLIFYAWGEPVYLLLLIAVALINYLCGLGISASSGKRKRIFLIVSCVLTLGILAVFKYAGFAAATLNSLTGLPSVIPQIALPIGISFYTFQALSYTVDVYRKDTEPEKSFANFLMYISLFHQCIAGPIVRYKDISSEILSRRVTTYDISCGISRFTVGLAKKALLANTCGLIADNILIADSAASDISLFSQNIALLSSRPALMLWLGVIAYMLEIYLDFSAYSDMAIGMGRMLGFHYKENFNYPYTARSVRDFWHRWHISLSDFFRDYVYIPLGGNRRGLFRTLLNMLIVWSLTGLWHGASWNYVLWGIWFFAFLTLERLSGNLFKKIPAAAGRLYTIIVVMFSWVLFRFKHLSMFKTVICGMFCGNGNPATDFETGTLWLNYMFFLAAAIIAVTPIVPLLKGFLERRAKVSRGTETVLNAIKTVSPTVLLLLSTAALVGNSYNPFLYFQF